MGGRYCWGECWLARGCFLDEQKFFETFRTRLHSPQPCKRLIHSVVVGVKVEWTVVWLEVMDPSYIHIHIHICVCDNWPWMTSDQASFPPTIICCFNFIYMPSQHTWERERERERFRRWDLRYQLHANGRFLEIHCILLTISLTKFILCYNNLLFCRGKGRIVVGYMCEKDPS